VCDDIKRLLDDNPNLRVASALSYGASLKGELAALGSASADQVVKKVSRDCKNGYNNDAILGYGGIGPIADRVDYDLNRGRCAPGGDYGGTVSMSGGGQSHTVQLDLTYTRSGVVEHDTTERIDVKPGGAATAFEFFMPSSAPAGGECDVELIAVYEG